MDCGPTTGCVIAADFRFGWICCIPCRSVGLKPIIYCLCSIYTWLYMAAQQVRNSLT